MKFYAFMFPTKPNVPQTLLGLTEEEAIASMLVATQATITDSDIENAVSNFNQTCGTNIDADAIILNRLLINTILNDSTPCLAAVKYFCAKEGFKINFTTVSIPADSEYAIPYEHEYDLNFVENILNMVSKRGGNIFTMLRASKVVFSEAELRSALMLYNKQAKNEYINEVFQNIKYDPTIVFDEQAVCEMLGWKKEDFKVIKYAMWGTKRKMKGNTYTRRICPYLYSQSQALGKTELAEDIMKPLGELVAVMTGTEYLDKSNHVTKELYAVIVDDIDSSDRQEIGSIKSTLTAKKQNARVMYSNSAKSITVNCWPWFTANKRVSQVMVDTSGNTRYREITIDRKVFPFIGKIDWLSLWRSIDENAQELFTSEDWEEHIETAEATRTQTYLDDFLNNCLYGKPPTFVFGNTYTPGSIFKEFQDYNESLINTYKLNPAKLAREISLAKFYGFTVETEHMASNPRMVKSIKFISNKPLQKDEEDIAAEEEVKKVINFAKKRSVI